MAGAASNFIVNIVELQNVITNAGGVDPLTTLSNTVSQLQEMVNYDQKQIKANTISRFSQSPIQVTDSLNLASNATLSIGGTVIAGGGTAATYTTLSTIGNVSSLTNYVNTLSTTDTAISFQVGAALTPLSLTAGGQTVISGGLKITAAGTPGIGRYLTCMDAAGTAQWQPPAMPSDMRWKEDIRPLEDVDQIMASIRGVRFRWSHGGGGDIGVVAQDLLPVIPEAVVEGTDGGPMLVQYHKLIPVLVEAVKGLERRVVELEAAAARQA